jgi:bacillopeptidase F
VGDAAKFRFTGTSVTWLSRKGPSQGIAAVYIDGASRGTVDLYAASWAAFSMSYNGLASKAHTVKIVVTGRKNAASAQSNITIDGFRVGTVLTEDTSPRIVFDGWTGVTSAAASGGAYRWATAASANSSFAFTGTAITWVTATGPANGKARVTIDGVDKGVVDLYTSARRWKVQKTFTGLSAGSHTIRVQALGTKNASSTGARVVVDGYIAQ